MEGSGKGTHLRLLNASAHRLTCHPMSTLLDDLSAYDGKAVTLLGEAEARHGTAAGYLGELAVLSASDLPQVSDGATWLLKAALEEGRVLSEAETRTLISGLARITHWPAQLHICQFLERVEVPADAAAPVADWLAGLLAHKRPFLRAWSMSALCALAAQHGAFKSQAEAALAAAETDQAASVRARARHAGRP